MDKTGSCYTCSKTVSLDYDGYETGYIAPEGWSYIEVPGTDEFFLHCPVCLPAAEKKEQEIYKRIKQ